ncbi:hypothetical protein ACIBHY_04115 [Nonomuraea sp. NPDC050547]|uniref:hypothetical protein n=1 Tax=Nonomuraea sp. NPDC050547 TaxID=3364368 RepID=UPI00379EE29F
MPGTFLPSRAAAFLGGLCAIAEGNAVLLSAHEQACADDKFTDPSHLFWHAHLTSLLEGAGPDPGFLAHALLALFDGALTRHVGPGRFTDSVKNLAATLI